MEIKSYMSQTLKINDQINAKIDKIAYYRNLSTKVTSTYSLTSGAVTSRSRVEDCVIAIIALEDEINRDIDKLVKLKRELEDLIKCVPQTNLIILLELRYICCKTWKQIAEDMHYDVSHIYRLHGCALNALNKVKKIAKDESK
jgi:DNA-directed RNA polymerase specialized sigma subunit